MLDVQGMGEVFGVLFFVAKLEQGPFDEPLDRIAGGFHVFVQVVENHPGRRAS